VSKFIASPNADISVKVNENKLSSFLQDLNSIKNELAYDHKEDQFVKRGLKQIEKLKSQRDKNTKPAAKRVTTPKGSTGHDPSFSGLRSAQSNSEFNTKSRSRDRDLGASATSSSKRA